VKKFLVSRDRYTANFKWNSWFKLELQLQAFIHRAMAAVNEVRLRNGIMIFESNSVCRFHGSKNNLIDHELPQVNFMHRTWLVNHVQADFRQHERNLLANFS